MFLLGRVIFEDCSIENYSNFGVKIEIVSVLTVLRSMDIKMAATTYTKI